MKKFEHKNIINRVSSRNKARQSISCFDHCNELTVYRQEMPETLTSQYLPSTVPLKQVDDVLHFGIC